MRCFIYFYTDVYSSAQTEYLIFHIALSLWPVWVWKQLELSIKLSISYNCCIASFQIPTFMWTQCEMKGETESELKHRDKTCSQEFLEMYCDCQVDIWHSWHCQTCVSTVSSSSFNTELQHHVNSLHSENMLAACLHILPTAGA